MNVARHAARLGAISVIAGAAVLGMPATANAHVTITPSAVEGGGFSVVSFRVPTERDDASTTRVRVTFPKDQPIGSVRTTALPGWKITVDLRTLDEPIEMFGEEVDEVVSAVTWNATGGGIAPDQFEDFDVSLGVLPESGEMAFQALQTYSSGERVNWNQVAVDDSVEPEHPAPVLRLTPPSVEDGVQGVSGEDVTGDGASGAATEDGTDPAPTIALTMSGAALLLSLVAVVLAGKRRRA